MRNYEKLHTLLRLNPTIWLITGVAGFIGSNLLEKLLLLDQQVVGLDNFSTGKKTNLEAVRRNVSPRQWENFTFLEGDIRELQTCRDACRGVRHVLHQAALGSVPRSIADPITTNETNITGFLNMLVAARDEGVESFTYAASSSTYGDHPALPKTEDRIGKPLSPYAITKYANELYAEIFKTTYGFVATGLRYFNVFGPRQDPNGAYAAVIPRWIAAMVRGESIYINGDGETSRDFCYIDNAIQANLLAAIAPEQARGQVYNVAVGARTSLNQLFAALRSTLANNGVEYNLAPHYRDFRRGDVRHSQADITKAKNLLGYEPRYTFQQGIEETVPHYIRELRSL